MKAVALGILVLSATACGGGAPPSAISIPRVTVAVAQPQKDRVYNNPALNLVKRLIDLSEDRLLVVGNDLMCTVERDRSTAKCVSLPIDFYNHDVLMDADGNPVAIVGNGGWGSPSAAAVTMTGALRWRFDGGYDTMDTPVVAGSPDRGLVLVGNRVMDLATGSPVQSALCKCGAIGSADFDRDGRLEIVHFENDELRVVNSEGRELIRREVGGGFDRAFVVTDRDPLVILSKDRDIAVYNHELARMRHLQTPREMPSLSPVAAAFLGGGTAGALAVLAKGRGGWHRTVLYVFSAQGTLVYAEVLGDDYESILDDSRPGGALTFLIGGRGDVWSYRFPSGTVTPIVARQ